MRAWKFSACAGAAVAAACAVTGAAMAQETQASRTPVTVFDSGLEPYTAYGRAQAGGSVIVFSRAHLSPFGNVPEPTTPLAPPAAIAPDLGPPVETAAGATPATMQQPRQVRSPAPAPPASTPAITRESAQAQDSGAPAGKRYVDGIYAINKDYLLSYPQNLYRILSAPRRFDRSDWITTALVIGAGSALFILDEPLRDFWQNDVKSGTTGDISDGLRKFGDSQNILFGSLAAYALAETLDTAGMVDARREKSAALLTLQSFLLTQGIITGTKYISGRNRPQDTDDSFDFEGPSKGDSNASFPSGHAGSAFAVASVLAETYGPDNPWVPWAAYSLATGTALSRIDDDKHWFSDVFFGSAVGYFVGTTLTRYSPFLERNNLTLMPFNRGDASGVGLAYKF